MTLRHALSQDWRAGLSTAADSTPIYRGVPFRRRAKAPGPPVPRSGRSGPELSQPNLAAVPLPSFSPSFQTPRQECKREIIFIFVPLKIDSEKKTISLGVKDLAALVVGPGVVDEIAYGVARMTLGRLTHESYQAERSRDDKSFRKEISVSHSTRVDEFEVLIRGRIDGVFERGGITVVEEVKSTLRTRQEVLRYDAAGFERYRLQLQLYLYFVWVSGVRNLEGVLTLISLVDGGRYGFTIDFDPTSIESLIRDTLRQVISEWRAGELRAETKRQLAPRVQFPFPEMRRYQSQMMERIEEALLERKNVMVCAPTGVGKTVGALMPALRLALLKNKKIFFITSKTTQQQLVLETVRHILATAQAESVSAGFNVLVLRAKEKMCANEVCFCHPDFCDYAKNYFVNLENSGLVEHFSSRAMMLPDEIFSKGSTQGVCPFELSLELVERADLVICDYNYVFDPWIALRLFALGEPYDHCLLIIDEAHNLYSRGRDYYSPELERAQVQALKTWAQSRRNQFKESGAFEASPTQTGRQSALNFAEPEETDDRLLFDRLTTLFTAFDNYFERAAFSSHENVEGLVSAERKSLVSLDMKFLTQKWFELESMMLDYFIYRKRRREVKPEDPFIDFYFNFSRFLSVASIGGNEFSTIYDASENAEQIKIVCKDPSRQLGERLSGFSSAIAMSATLQPMEFFRDVLGLEKSRTLTLSLPSPFPPENRLIAVVPEVLTTYTQRARFYEKIARLIEVIVRTRPGNYFAFFPSFDFLAAVQHFLSLTEFRVVAQQRVMDEEARTAVLRELGRRDGRKLHSRNQEAVSAEAGGSGDSVEESGEEDLQPTLVLAVQGGIFAEGVDYPGETLIGAIVVGPGLPRVSFEQELMRQYYDEQFADGEGGERSRGFAYAYLFPGMNRVIQSAGRVIRSDTDRGVIILLDRRFAQPPYIDLLPEHWYRYSPQELVLEDWVSALKRFWGNEPRSPRKVEPGCRS
jgi:DNA excision repair protein ERCC-2